MKNHNVPASPTHTAHEGGVVYHLTEKGTNHLSGGFNWKKACARALEKQYYRAIHLARCNPDYQIKYPEELRENPDCKVLTHCCVSAQKRILEKHEKILQSAIVPTVIRPKRLNRVS